MACEASSPLLGKLLVDWCCTPNAVSLPVPYLVVPGCRTGYSTMVLVREQAGHHGSSAGECARR